MKEMDGVFAVILASGQSIRMGKPKLLLPWRGISLIEHVLTKITLFPFEGITIVIPDQNKQLKNIVSSFHCEPLYNTTPQLGMGHSLALAIRSLPPSAQAVLILLGDQPRLNTDDIQKVCEVFQRMRSTKDDCKRTIMQIKYRDGLVGHPILFTKYYFDELMSLKGDKGGRDIIRNNERYLYLCNSENEYPDDIDTPNDYQRLIFDEGEINQ